MENILKTALVECLKACKEQQNVNLGGQYGEGWYDAHKKFYSYLSSVLTQATKEATNIYFCPNSQSWKIEVSETKHLSQVYKGFSSEAAALEFAQQLLFGV